jgi:hypothetical protein
MIETAAQQISQDGTTCLIINLSECSWETTTRLRPIEKLNTEGMPSRELSYVGFQYARPASIFRQNPLAKLNQSTSGR